MTEQLEEPEVTTNIEPSAEEIQRWRDMRRMVEATQLKMSIMLRELDDALGPQARIERVGAYRTHTWVVDASAHEHDLEKLHAAHPVVGKALGNEYLVEITISAVHKEKS